MPASGASQRQLPAAASRHPAVRRESARLADQVRRKLRGKEQAAAPAETPRRRTDVRLGLPALLVWGAAVAGVWLTPAMLAALCMVLVVLAVVLLARAARGKTLLARRRSFLITAAVALMLAAAAAAHSAVSSSQRHDGPIAEAAAAGKSVVAIVEITGSPRGLTLPGQAGTPERWSVAARTEEVTLHGSVIRTRADLVVMGSSGWENVIPGQLVRTAGKLRPPEPGQQEAAILAASMAPGAAASGDAGRGADAATGPAWQMAAKELRGRYVAAAGFLAPDPRGLLPGMVTGDTSALDEGLNGAMKTVGMTHLTAVSGANCSLVLGALLIAARSLRLPRLVAGGLALGGLGMFVVLVGPDASVLRAALMGSIAIASLAGGRAGRGLSFLCLAVMGLLLIDPGLAISFGFLLSVLATLGIIVLGPRMMEWTPAIVPRWAAAAWAVPLSAQLLCGPVIVLLQPQFSTYSLLANIVAAPLVAPVTLLGTAAVPLVLWMPWLATALIAVAGTFSAGVAGVARTAAALPGASLPWPEGPLGFLTMVLLSALTFAGVLAAVRPRRLVCLVLAWHGQLVSLIETLEALPTKTLRHRGR
ncbi:ComEC/Rec2 family competence protein [Pseudarthrobacter sp. BIM B-2242]|uniref:ComEC/Rec2 family competence protein n=1 Tax=Pseudarthrobacter sp. BIM B-2242 TaxID=2772401 RepID=UPI001CC6E703|nr:ComEC/Rec2 family competence protein [Pseudarthrobacter sp. BIM B-2242]